MSGWHALTRRPVARQYHMDDPDLRRSLARDGYVVVDLLDPPGLDHLRAVRDRHGPAPGDPQDGLFNDSWSTDQDYKRAVAAELEEALGGVLRRHLPAYRPLGYAHIVKWPGPGGAVVAHRDPTFADERRFRTIMLWCPLEDVDDHSGTLWVTPGSHRRTSGVRVHQSPANVVADITCRMGGPARPLQLRAGEAILYDHALIHLSGPNDSNHPRVAVASPLVPRLASPRYAVAVGDNRGTLVEIDESFFVEHRLCDLDVGRVLVDYPTVGTFQHRVAGP